jgi:hypothetical protein
MDMMRKVQVDREALTRALKLARDESPGRARQIDSMRADRSWFEAASFASYSCQCDRLRLKPWMSPPCIVGDKKPVDDPQQHGLIAAWELRRKLLAAGLSAYEPDPLAALEAAKPAA